MYPITSIPDDASEYPEQVGSKSKFWYSGQSQMFKLSRDGTGEDWAEKIACELCTALGLPHAHYDLATWQKLRGTTTPNFVPSSGRLVLGNELLASFVSNYPGANRYRQRQHTVGRACVVIGAKKIRAPLDTPESIPLITPLDFFTGYILLDAWIGNTDRHHENWGFVVLGSEVHLAPTFDHASSLGRELSDAARADRLSTRDQRRNVQAYLAKTRSAFYRSEADLQPLSTMDAFKEVAKRSPTAKKYWLDKLNQIPDAEIYRIINEVPSTLMSEPARQFAITMLIENKNALNSGAEEI